MIKPGVRLAAMISCNNTINKQRYIINQINSRLNITLKRLFQGYRVLDHQSASLSHLSDNCELSLFSVSLEIVCLRFRTSWTKVLIVFKTKIYNNVDLPIKMKTVEQPEHVHELV